MKRLAIFAEGGTEQHFVEKLLRAIGESKALRIEKTKMKGGAKFPRCTHRLEIDAASDTQEFYVLIVDCGNDERVQSDIKELYESLCERNYDAIIGIRDVHPKTLADVPRLYKNLYFGIPTKPILPLILLAVMEVEAWFLAEYLHFEKINPALTLDKVRAAISFDPKAGDVQTRLRPSEDLNTAYATVGESYTKDPVVIQRTIEALNCSHLYVEVAARIPPIKMLVRAIEEFFTD